MRPFCFASSHNTQLCIEVSGRILYKDTHDNNTNETWQQASFVCFFHRYASKFKWGFQLLTWHLLYSTLHRLTLCILAFSVQYTYESTTCSRWWLMNRTGVNQCMKETHIQIQLIYVEWFRFFHDFSLIGLLYCIYIEWMFKSISQISRYCE